MQNIQLTGVMTALVTPMRRGQVDFASLGTLIDLQLRGGVSALVLCGTTGEAPTLSEDEKAEIIRFTSDRVRGAVPVIAGCGSPSTQYAARLAANAERAGADAVLTVTPYYNKCSDEGLYLHYKAVAQSCNLPLIAYNVPSRTGVNISASACEKLCTIDSLIGIKEASGSIATAQQLISRFGGRLDFYSGCDELIAPMCAVGACGAISVVSNILPEKTVRLFRLCAGGTLRDAARLQLELYPVIRALFSEVNPIPVKTALAMLGLCSEEMRLPLCGMSPSARRAFAAELHRHGVL